MDDHQPREGLQDSAYRRPVGWRPSCIGMLTGVRLERVRKAMQAVEDRVVGNKRSAQPISRKGDKVIQKEIEKELKRLVAH